MKNIAQTNTNGKDLSQTPPDFMRSLCQLLSIKEFQLDVCALESTKKAKVCYSLEERNEDCLVLPWNRFNWCNPPFSNPTPFILKAISEAKKGNTSAVIFPNSPENEYVRIAKESCDTFIEMPYRMKFLKVDGTMFLDKQGKEQGPQFSCAVALFTRIGLERNTAQMYYDFRG